VKHDASFPTPQLLLERTVAGYNDVHDGVKLIIRAVDADDTRPVWFSNWRTDNGAAESCLKRALDQVLRERGPEGYATFKGRLRLSSADKFGDHTAKGSNQVPGTYRPGTYRPLAPTDRTHRPHPPTSRVQQASGFRSQTSVNSQECFQLNKPGAWHLPTWHLPTDRTYRPFVPGTY